MASDVDRIVAWLRQEVTAAGCQGVVVGLSGGIDSATVAALARRGFGDNAYGLIMPCDSAAADAEDARLAAEEIGIAYREVDLTPVYRALLEAFGLPDDLPRMVRANMKPRLRMTTLYAEAQLRQALVLGTGNRSELEIGYFTKYGDGGVDLLPIGEYLKHEVRDLARELGVPERIIERAPSAGLWEGQTDEGEMGLTYQELDHYLKTGDGTPIVRGLVDELHRRSEHKRHMPRAFRR